MAEQGSARAARGVSLRGKLAFAFSVLGVAIAGRSPTALGGVALFWVLSHVYLVWLEEPQLEETFGKDYRAYRARTPRYLGLPERSASNE